MASADIQTFPRPEIVALLPAPPTKPRTMPRGTVKAIPINFDDSEEDKVPTNTQEMDSMAEMFQDVKVGNYNPDPLSAIERVFYDQAQDKLYKLYDDGTWDFVIIRENQI